MRWGLVVPMVALTLNAGCGGGGGQPDTLDGVTKYDAAVVARDAMNDEILDTESIASGKTLLVGTTTADALDDGTLAWRVEFVDVNEEPSGICAWVWIKSRTPLRDNYNYVVDACPSPSAS